MKRRISVPALPQISRGFDFEFPEFLEPASKIVSRNIEAWGEELLQEYRSGLDGVTTQESAWEHQPQVWLRGRYHVIRHDSFVISIEYSIERYYSGAAHRSTETRVQNFVVNPFQPVTIETLVKPFDGLNLLSKLVRADIFQRNPEMASDEWAESGTRPDYSNFSLFTIGEYGITFHFEEYQIACYAMGRQKVFIGFDQARAAINSEIYKFLINHGGI